MKDIKGQRFGRLTAIEMVGVDKSRCAMWLCKCDCGTEKIVRGKNLRSGETKSCGCTRKTETAEKLREKSTKHGMTNTRIYAIWCGMKSRCYNSHRKKYKDYGQKGIIVCDKWLESFEEFRDWAMAHGYRDDLTIDRKDPKGPYSPENCRWITQKEQQNNRTNNKMITFNGKTQTLSQWAEEIGMKAQTLQKRFEYGWSTERALTEKVRGN